MAEASTPDDTTVQTGADEASQNPVADSADQNPSANQPASSDDGGQGDDQAQSGDQNQPQPNENDNGEDQASTDDVDEWASKQGYDLNNLTPEQSRNMAKRWRDTQSAYHKEREAAKAASEFSQSIQRDNQAAVQDIEDPLERAVALQSLELQQIRSDRTVEQFFTQNPQHIAHREKMADIVARDVEKYGDRMDDYWTENLDVLAKIASGESVDEATQNGFEQGRQQERENLTRQQQLSSSKQHATNSASAPTKGAPITSVQQIRSMDASERKSREQEIANFFAEMRQYAYIVAAPFKQKIKNRKRCISYGFKHLQPEPY